MDNMKANMSDNDKQLTIGCRTASCDTDTLMAFRRGGLSVYLLCGKGISVGDG